MDIAMLPCSPLTTLSLSLSQSLSCSLSTVSCLDLAGEFAPLDHLGTRFFFFFFTDGLGDKDYAEIRSNQ